MYKYETHLHTAPVSKCATVSVRDNLEYYKSLGYDGVFITNHFLDGNINVDPKWPYADRINFYFADYEEGLKIGLEIGIKVFLGVELTYGGTDFLIYGLDKEWYLQHPEILEMKKTDELKLMAESGALIIQAHPFREATYINHIRLFPRHVHGVEIINACRKPEENEMAKIYASHYELLSFAGSDNHTGAKRTSLAGVQFETPINDVQDFVDRVKDGKAEIFTLTIE
ncbi:MAG: PHP domain-containing protein [Clostridia bacterium]|nr:PHP domain-containing protein [Clostridia bacterium]